MLAKKIKRRIKVIEIFPDKGFLRVLKWAPV
jgi:transposase-like protein